jgi:amino acid transporter
MGWNYAMSWLVVFPFELIAASITIRFWTGDATGENASISDAVWIAVFLVLIILVNVFGIRGYGEVEFVLGTLKVIAVIGFILTGIIINAGGVPTDTRYVPVPLPPPIHSLAPFKNPRGQRLTDLTEATSAPNTGTRPSKPSGMASRASAPSSSPQPSPSPGPSSSDSPPPRPTTPANPSPRPPSRSSGE